MSLRVEIKVDLASERKLLRKLAKYEDRVQRRVMKSVLTAGVQPILAKARKIAPIGTGKNAQGVSRDHLKKTLIKRAKFYKNSGITNITIGTDARKSPHGHLVTGGTLPHGVHPGTKPNPFIEKAAALAAPAVRSKMRTQLKKRMEAEAAKLAKQ